jgi:hypothetical protein
MPTRTHKIRLVVAAAVAVAAAAFWLTPLGSAFDEVNEKPAPLGVVGMTDGQTLRISVAYVKGFDPQPDPPGCILKVGFADQDGTTIGDPNVAELRPGVSESFDHVAVGDPHIRQYVRPIVSDVTRRGECPAVVTGELLHRDGLTGIIVYDNQPVVPSVFLEK